MRHLYTVTLTHIMRHLYIVTQTQNTSIFGFLSPLQCHTMRHLYMRHLYNVTHMQIQTRTHEVLRTWWCRPAPCADCQLESTTSDDQLESQGTAALHRTPTTSCVTHIHKTVKNTDGGAGRWSATNQWTLNSMLTSRKLIGQTTKPGFRLYVSSVGEPADPGAPG